MTALNRALPTSGDTPAKSLLSDVVGKNHDRLFLGVAPAASQMLPTVAALAHLASSATYTEDTNDRFDAVLGYFLLSRVAYLVYASSISTLVVEQSDNGTVWTDCPGSPWVNLPANTSFDTGWIPVTARYWRARLTNNGSTYTFERLFVRIGAGPEQVTALQPRGTKRAPIAQVTLTAATPTLLLPANPRRTLAIIRNVGTSPLYLAGSNAVDATGPHRLEPDDPWYDDDTHDAWWGYASIAGAVIAAMEIDGT
jgi:hypothetical protein